MFSQTVLAGRLGRDPEVRTTSTNKRMATLRICTQSRSNGKTFAEWHTIVFWTEGLIDLVSQRLHKGDLILVTGQLRTRSFGEGDATRSRTEIVMGPHDQLTFLDVRGAADAAPEAAPG